MMVLRAQLWQRRGRGLPCSLAVPLQALLEEEEGRCECKSGGRPSYLTPKGRLTEAAKGHRVAAAQFSGYKSENFPPSLGS